MWPIIFTALGLMLILEGALPFVSPEKWRQLFIIVIQMKTSEIRFLGLTSMLLGLLLIFLVQL